MKVFSSYDVKKLDYIDVEYLDVINIFKNIFSDKCRDPCEDVSCPDPHSECKVTDHEARCRCKEGYQEVEDGDSTVDCQLEDPCQGEGWENRVEEGLHCLFFADHQQPTDRDVAKQFCVKKGAHLIEITSAQQMVKLGNILKTKPRPPGAGMWWGGAIRGCSYINQGLRVL